MMDILEYFKYRVADCENESHDQMVFKLSEVKNLVGRLTAAESKLSALKPKLADCEDALFKCESERDQYKAQIDVAKNQYPKDDNHIVDANKKIDSQSVEISGEGVQARIAFYPENPKQAVLLSWNKLCIGEHDLYTRPSPNKADVPFRKVTDYGQINEGDFIILDYCGKRMCVKANMVLQKGTENEEVVYNRKNNFYFITSMILDGTSNHKNVYVVRLLKRASLQN